MRAFEQIAEMRIRDAQKRGEMDNLKGQGLPLPRDGIDLLREELRVPAIIMRNSGYLPEELEIRHDIYHLNQLIKDLPEGDIKTASQERLRKLLTRLDLVRNRMT